MPLVCPNEDIETLSIEGMDFGDLLPLFVYNHGAARQLSVMATLSNKAETVISLQRQINTVHWRLLRLAHEIERRPGVDLTLLPPEFHQSFINRH